MRREIIDSMQARGFGEFIAACDNLRNCKYVIAESKITALLKSIADNKQLYSLFASTLDGFDYNKVFYECVSVSDRMFVLPNDYKNAIALVFRLLLDIDNGKIKLESFLAAYFAPGSLNEEFARFGLEIIAPFEAYCKMYFSQNPELADADVKLPGQTQGSNFLQAPAPPPQEKLDEELKKDALFCVSELTDVGNDAINSIVDRREYSACLDGLARALRSYGYNDIVSAFIGVKYAVMYFFASKSEVIDIFKKLEYDIKHISDN